MCRSIKTLRKRDVVATDEEIEAAARQFVRKITAMREPTARHHEAFESAVDEIATASKRVLDRISSGLPGAAGRAKG
jgi:hypothetical protein